MRGDNGPIRQFLMLIRRTVAWCSRNPDNHIVAMWRRTMWPSPRINRACRPRRSAAVDEALRCVGIYN